MSKVHESLRAGTNVPAVNHPISEAQPDGHEPYLLRQAELQSVIDTLSEHQTPSKVPWLEDSGFSIGELQQEVLSLKVEIEAMRDAMRKQNQENEEVIEAALIREAELRLEVEQLKKRLAMAAAQLKHARRQGYLS